MPEVSGERREALRRALCQAFPRPNALRMFLSERMDVELEQVAEGNNYAEQVFDLIQWMQSEGRLTELVSRALGAKPGNAALRAFETGVRLPDDEPVKLEAILRGRAGFVDVDRWIGRLRDLKRGVCRVDAKREAVGTGLLVASRLVMTCRHVLRMVRAAGVAPEAAPAPEGMAFRFDDTVPAAGEAAAPVQYAYRPGGLLFEAPEGKLDLALIEIDDAPGAPPLESRPSLRFSPRAAGAGDPVILIQHPDGEPLKLAFGSIKSDSGGRVVYSADTLPGSSGAPVLDPDLEVVAIHRAGAKPGNEGIPWPAIRDYLHAERPELLARLAAAPGPGP